MKWIIIEYNLTWDAFLLPGKFKIKVLLRIPQTARLSIANLVILSDSIKIALVKLGNSLLITSLVA